MNTLRQTFHVLAVIAWALWMGGFTFFTSVSLRVAHKVLSEAQEFGYVTQVVTHRLNVIGLIAALLLLAQLAAHWPVLVRWRRMLLGISWFILALTLAYLFHLHDAIAATVDFEQRVVIDAEGRSWALAAELLDRYDIAHSWDADQQRLVVGDRDVVPTFRDDAVQADVGWPLVEMILQSSQAPVILRGIIRDGRVWCRVVEFAEEFGISLQFNPLVLQERRGG